MHAVSAVTSSEGPGTEHTSPGIQEVEVRQIAMLARLLPARSEEAGRLLAGESEPRTRAFYLATSFVFAVLTYVAVQLIQAGGAIVNSAATATDPSIGNLMVHATSLIAWAGACMLAG